MKLRLLSILSTLCFLQTTTALALDAATELAKKSQNPVENMVSVPFNNNFNFGYGDNGNTQYVLDAKPVIPFSVNEDWNIISRTIIPIIHQPNPIPGRNYLTGMGDLSPAFYLSPGHPGAIIWGAGPIAVLPTATKHDLGQGKYSIGPSFVVLTMPDRWVIGALLFNVWSVGGQSNRPNVNSFELQYFINYNLPEGWYVTTQPIITADWTATSTNRWVVPIGFGVGHIFNIGKQAINASLQSYTNVVTASYGPNWQAQLNISLLFPETDK